MTENFLNALGDTSNRALTENGATAYATTKSAVLDFFGMGGAIRNRSAEDQQAMFARAWNENPELALKAMFYFRDVRGGQGQRNAFRNQLRFLANVAPNVVRNNLLNVPEYGRWDDMYALADTDLERDVFAIIRNQFNADLNSEENVSLLGKWLKSTNASNEEARDLARKTRKALRMSEKRYRKALSFLRDRIGVVERTMEQQKWGDVDYSHVPSLAMVKYRNAFRNHDGDRFGSFIDAVNKGEAKINAGTLYPHDIVGRLLGFRSDSMRGDEAQALWNALPDYMPEGENAICVVDTSASMNGTPMEVAIALGLYAAERAKGPYKDHFITFSSKPQLQKVTGDSIKAKVDGLRRAHWEMNTDIEAVFDLILKTAVQNGLSQDEMVDKLYIISDMEFDAATTNTGYSYRSNGGPTTAPDATLFQTIRAKFEAKGYQMPNLVFWNVDSRNDQFPMSMDERGFQAVSGFSPSIFEHLVGGEFISAYDIMLKVLNSDRYANVTL
jgi:hypothetical protein